MKIMSPAALALGSALLFGASTPLAKLLVGDVHFMMLAALLYLGSGVGLAVLIMVDRAVRPGKAIALPDRAGWIAFALAIAAGGVAAPVAFVAGLARMPAAGASLLLNLESVFTALMAWLVFRENYDARIAAGMALIVAGGLVMALGADAGLGASFGPLLIGAACMLWAIDNNLMRKASNADARVVSCIKGVVAGSTNLAIALAVGAPWPTTTKALSAATLGLFSYGVSFMLFVVALRELGAARTGAYYSTAPFFGAALAIALLHEPITFQLLTAAPLMAIGVWLHLTERHSHRHEHAALHHSHRHVHDDHHQHDHAAGEDGHEPHSHAHDHEPLVHEHPHAPDLHHRHH